MFEGEKAMERREKKEELKKLWEDCFDMKIDDVLTEKGLKRFWSDDTSVIGATAMLDKAAFNLLLSSLNEDVSKVVVVVCDESKGSLKEDEHDNKHCNGKNENKFKVSRVDKDGKIIQLYDDEYETEDKAKAYIQEIVNCSSLTLKDFAIVKVQVL